MKIKVFGHEIIELEGVNFGNTYNNCTIGQPYPIVIQKNNNKAIEPEFVGEEERKKVIDYVSDATGVDRSMVEWIFIKADEFYTGPDNDKKDNS